MTENMKTIYCVAYWFYCDTDTMVIEAFETQEEADKFEEVVWDKCQEAHIECECVSYIGKIKQYNDALSHLNNTICEIKDDDD